MTGHEHDEDGPETFRPVPHPDDRLWRHPSEVGAMRAAQANAETTKLPVVRLNQGPARSKLQIGLMAAAGVVVVGAAALTLGVISSNGVSNDAEVATAPIAHPVDQLIDESAASGSFTESTTAEVTIDHPEDGEDLLASRVHDATAASLPRIQAATSDGTREGSGLFITDAGHIATSAGLIDNADYIVAWTVDDQRWTATVIASDAVSDVAIIQISSEDWPAIALGTGTDLRTGQYALALDHDDDEISIGQVTSVDGPLVGIEQSAATPGSAIMDDTGVVIAMVTSDDTNSYATPAWLLEQVTVDLISTGHTVHTWLGVIVESHPAEDGMVMVSDVIVDSPAHQAGVRPGDAIDTFNGSATPDAASLFQQVQDLDPGEDAVLTITRNGNRRIIVATVAELNDQ